MRKPGYFKPGYWTPHGIRVPGRWVYPWWVNLLGFLGMGAWWVFFGWVVLRAMGF